ncbi:MAG: hypothetical protein JXR91_16060 [Deltaproteobacteria bacterium]|nr:hypothetical protein [Deltaproteobacteria bacterium]
MKKRIIVGIIFCLVLLGASAVSFYVGTSVGIEESVKQLQITNSAFAAHSNMTLIRLLRDKRIEDALVVLASDLDSNIMVYKSALSKGPSKLKLHPDFKWLSNLPDEPAFFKTVLEYRKNNPNPSRKATKIYLEK